MKSKRYFQTTSYGQEKRRKSSWLVSLLLGVVIGVAAVVGIAIYLNYASTPFTNMQQFIGSKANPIASESSISKVDADRQMAALDAKIKELTHTDDPDTVLHEEKSASAETTSQEFDFYKILPGKSDIAPVAASSAKNQKKALRPVRQYYLQVGSFHHASEANNLKAKLALMGIHAKIESMSTPERGLVHRVRIGPINKAKIESLRILLQQNRIEAVVTTL